MNLLEEKNGNVLVVRPQDARLDSAISSEFKTELLRMIERENANQLLVDLQKVEYVDSSGLGALLFGHRHAQAHSGSLKLMRLNQKVRTLIKIANLEDILEVFEDEDTAVASFA